MTEATPGFYLERINRYRVMRHEEMPEAHKAEMRINGIDPDDNWRLIWSFETLEDATKQAEEDRLYAPVWSTTKVVDAGEAMVIERQIW